MLAEKNKEIKKAVAVLAELSQDEKTRLAYEYEEMARRDYVSRMEGARRDGRKEGLLEVARGLKDKGVDINIIIDTTGLTEQEVDAL